MAGSKHVECPICRKGVKSTKVVLIPLRNPDLTIRGYLRVTENSDLHKQILTYVKH